MYVKTTGLREKVGGTKLKNFINDTSEKNSNFIKIAAQFYTINCFINT